MEIVVSPQGPVTFKVTGKQPAVIQSYEKTGTIRIVQSASPIPVSGGGGGGGSVNLTWTPPSAQSTWLIPHNLGFKPQVTILDPQGNVVYGNVQYLDLNTVSISFTLPFYGSAQLG